MIYGTDTGTDARSFTGIECGIFTDFKAFSCDIGGQCQRVAIARALARDVANKVIFMDDGIILEQGNPKELFEHPKEERTRQFLSRYTQG